MPEPYAGQAKATPAYQANMRPPLSMTPQAQGLKTDNKKFSNLSSYIMEFHNNFLTKYFSKKFVN